MRSVSVLVSENATPSLEAHAFLSSWLFWSCSADILVHLSAGQRMLKVVSQTVSKLYMKGKTRPQVG